MVDNFRLLLNQYFVHRTIEWFYEQYINRLTHLGFATIHSQVTHQALRNAIIEFYGESLLEIFLSPVIDQRDNWLQMIVEDRAKRFIRSVTC
jgi:hypothetical protein